MTTKSDRGLPWVRIFVEGVVIVGSILLAFGIDAWWDQLQEARELSADLAALRTDFDRAAAELELIHRNSELAVRASDSLLTLMRGASGTVDVPVALVVNTIRPPTPDPASGALQALVSSGRLGLIKDPQLRGALADWPAALSDLSSKAALGEEFVYGQLLPKLGELTDVWELTDIRVTQILTPREGDDPVDRAHSTLALPINSELVGLLHTRRVMASLLIGGNWFRVERALSQIRDGLEQSEIR